LREIKEKEQKHARIKQSKTVNTLSNSRNEHTPRFTIARSWFAHGSHHQVNGIDHVPSIATTVFMTHHGNLHNEQDYRTIVIKYKSIITYVKYHKKTWYNNRIK
jgi:hypothetical protein